MHSVIYREVCKCEVVYAVSQSSNIKQPVLPVHHSDEHLLVQTEQGPIPHLEELRAWKENKNKNKNYA